MKSSAAEIRAQFSYHQPSSAEVVRSHEAVREIITVAAVEIGELLPGSRERSLALTKLHEAMMWANCAVALGQVENNGIIPER